MMPGGSPEAYKHIEAIVEKVAAQVGWLRPQGSICRGRCRAHEGRDLHAQPQKVVVLVRCRGSA